MKLVGVWCIFPFMMRSCTEKVEIDSFSKFMFMALEMRHNFDSVTKFCLYFVPNGRRCLIE